MDDPVTFAYDGCLDGNYSDRCGGVVEGLEVLLAMMVLIFVLDMYFHLVPATNAGLDL